MSKKSRRRNKKILSALLLGGLGLAAANRGKGTPFPRPKAGTIDQMAANNMPKNDTEFKETVYQDDIMKGGKGVKYQKPDLRFGQVINKQGDVQTLKPFESAGLSFGLSNRKATANAPQNQPKKERIPFFESPKNKAIRLSTASGRANTAAQEMMRGFKKGGRVKGCGIAKKGLGRAMKKGRK